MKNIINYKYISKVAYIILPLYLVGCNNTIGNNVGSSQLTLLQKSVHNADEPTSYQGSQAYNSSLFELEDVNAQTGTLSVSKNLISRSGVTKDLNLNLNLIYSSSDSAPGILHLPKGWNYQLSYVVPNKSVNIDGSNFVLDSSWYDLTNYHSGLKYINNHAIEFKSVLPAKRLTCSNTHDKRPYSYFYSGTHGELQYFDVRGKLLATANHFGNCISYYYSDDDQGDIYNSFLDHIVDSYGKNYQFRYMPNEVTITSSDKPLAHFIYSNSRGISSVSDAMGYITNYNYNDTSAHRLINEIKYPSGLITHVQYTKLPYSICSGGSGSLNAVSQITHEGKSNNGLLNKTQYTYGEASSGSNFTGYNKLSGGYCLSNDRDALIDSNNFDFKYDVTITKIGGYGLLNQKSRIFYNFLHLPTRQENLAASGAVMQSESYAYAISKNKILRSSSYSSPIRIETQKDNKTVAIVNNRYDDYNQMISSNQSVLIKGQLTPYKNSTTTYFPEASFYLVKNSTDNDLLFHENLTTVNQLTADGYNIKKSSILYNNQPWKSSGTEYDTQGRVVNETIEWSGNHEGIKKSNISNSYDYNSASGILTETKKDFNGSIVKTTAYDTTLPGSPIVVLVSPSGKVTKHTYDALGRELSVITPGGHTTTNEYHVYQDSSKTNQVITTDPLNHFVTINYDELARPILVTDNGDNKEATSRVLEYHHYNQLDELDSTTNVLGKTTSYTYDELGRTVKSTDSLNNIVKTEYDDANIIINTYLNGVLIGKESQDGVGNKLQVIKYSSDKQHTSKQDNTYNGFGQQVKSERFMDNILLNTKITTYDGDGKAESTTQQTYDKVLIEKYSNNDLLGNPLKLNFMINKAPMDNGYTNTYNELGQLKTSKNSLGIKNMSYDIDGNLKNVSSYAGNTDYEYDDDNNLITKTENGITLKKSYDANGNLLSISNSEKNNNNAINYEYTSTNLLKAVKYPDGKTMSYTYYANGLLKTKTNALGAVTTYIEDSNGRISSITTNDSNLTYTYDDEVLNAGKYGILKTVTLKNKIGQILTHTYSYDSWGNIATDMIKQGVYQTLITYRRDSLQRLSQQIITSTIPNSTLDMTKTFAYDGLNHLLSSISSYKNTEQTVNESYTYDQDGNVISYTNNESTTYYEYNNDQLVKVDQQRIDYDQAGNMLNDPEGNVYTYNKLNQLTAVSKNYNLVTGYSYYTDGLLSNKVTNKNNLTFYYDNGHADSISNSSISGELAVTNFMLSDTGSPIASYRNNQENYYQSVANSIISMLDASGILINSYKYTGYGSVSSDKVTYPSQSFLWNGEYNDSNSNLVYLRARFYNPKLMRFMNADTYAVSNLYNFGHGDPINNIDPSGHMDIDPSMVLNGIFILSILGPIGYGALKGGVWLFRRYFGARIAFGAGEAALGVARGELGNAAAALEREAGAATTLQGGSASEWLNAAARAARLAEAQTEEAARLASIGRTIGEAQRAAASAAEAAGGVRPRNRWCCWSREGAVTTRDDRVRRSRQWWRRRGGGEAEPRMEPIAEPRMEPIAEEDDYWQRLSLYNSNQY